MHAPYRTPGNLEARIALHERFRVHPTGWWPWVRDRLEGEPGARFLEVGCGPGTLWTGNERASRLGWKLTLSDSSIGMVRAAARSLAGYATNFRFEVADAGAIPHLGASFDRVVANHMLYHVPDRPHVLAEIRRVLRPGGRLYASTLGGDSLQEIAELVRATTGRRDFWRRRPSDGFTLENAPAQLTAVFETCELLRYSDALRITEVAPVLDYLRSTQTDPPFDEAELGAIGEAVRERLRVDGAYHVRKSAGVFLCRREH